MSKSIIKYIVSFTIEKLKILYSNHFKKFHLKQIIFGTCALVLSYCFYKTYYSVKDYFIQKNFKTFSVLVRTKRNERLQQFYSKYNNWNHFDKNKIINSTVINLIAMLRNNEITVQQIIISYGLNIATIGKELNLIADVDLMNSLSFAEECDELISKQKTINDRQPLKGIPISIKDHINVRGMLTTLGYVANSNNVAFEDALIVKVLRNKGAIPIVKSNISQGLMSLESGNLLWGDSKNPLNHSKTPGGSSGGDAGLIVSKCVPIGIGTDFAGSIRIPCSFTGIYGFKPTSCRVSTLGHINLSSTLFTGFNLIKPSWGPIGKSIDDLVLIMQNLFGEFSDDPKVSNNSKFNYNIFNRILLPNSVKIGILLDNDFCETGDEIKYKLHLFSETLSKHGYIIDFISKRESNQINYKLYLLIDKILMLTSILLNSSEELNHLRKGLKGEKPYHFYTDWFNLMNSSNIWKKILGYYYKIIGERRLSGIILNNRNLSREEFIETIRLLEEAKTEFYNLFIKGKYNCLISPIMPFPAFDIGKSTTANYFNHFCLLTNVLDMPSGCLPFSSFNEMSNYDYTSKYKDSFSNNITQFIKTAKGLPYGIQIVTLPNEDEFCLNLMKQIDNLISIEKP